MQYDTEGTYKVKLTVNATSGNASKEIVGYVTVSNDDDGGNGEPDDPNAKIAYFPLDADVLDASTAGKDFDNATNSGADFAHVDRGAVLQFDGDDIITIQTGVEAADGLPTTALTVGTWVKINASEVWGGFVGCFQDNGTTEEDGWLLGQRSQKFSIALRGTGNSRMTYLVDPDTFTIGQWYYVTATYDGTTIKLYVDGVEKASSTEQSGDIKYPTLANSFFQLGSYKDKNEDNRMDGEMDEVSIWPRVLTTAEINTEMNGGPTLENSGFSFNESVINASVANDKLNIQMNTALAVKTIQIVNLQGAVVMDSNINATVQNRSMDVSNLSSGMYFVKVILSEGTSVVEKLLIP